MKSTNFNNVPQITWGSILYLLYQHYFILLSLILISMCKHFLINEASVALKERILWCIKNISIRFDMSRQFKFNIDTESARQSLPY